MMGTPSAPQMALVRSMPLSVDQFGKALVSAGLFTADELKALWNAIPADARPKQGDAFAKLLIERGKLS